MIYKEKTRIQGERGGKKGEKRREIFYCNWGKKITLEKGGGGYLLFR